MPDLDIVEATPPAATWTAVLDDLESRVGAAETGEIDRLNGWEPPALLADATADEAARAERLLARQQTLLTQLVARRVRVRTTQLALKRPEFRVPESAPVYLDRNA